MTDSDTSAPLLEARNLVKTFGGRRGSGPIVAVGGISFQVEAGECLAIVGESGSGKSTLARTILRLIQPDSGAILYRGTDLVGLSHSEMQVQRHPRKTVAKLIAEPWEIHSDVVRPADRPARTAELLRQVNLPQHFAGLHANQLSGGQRQRVAIARALALEPEILILDEPVSALDVSVQAQVIHVLMSLQERLGLAYIFISHDLALVRLVASKVAVMQKAAFVEAAPTEELFLNPRHEYTQTLLASSPALHEEEHLH